MPVSGSPPFLMDTVTWIWVGWKLSLSGFWSLVSFCDRVDCWNGSCLDQEKWIHRWRLSWSRISDIYPLEWSSMQLKILILGWKSELNRQISTEVTMEATGVNVFTKGKNVKEKSQRVKYWTMESGLYWGSRDINKNTDIRFKRMHFHVRPKKKKRCCKKGVITDSSKN